MTVPSWWPGLRLLVGVLPALLVMLTVSCKGPSQPTELRRLEPYGLQLEIPVGYTGGGAGGTFEFHGPDGAGRVRVAKLEGVTTVQGLRDAQLLANTGASVADVMSKPSPAKISGAPAIRGRLLGSDRRVYEVVAIQLPGVGVVLVQSSLPVETTADDADEGTRLFAVVRQSLKYTGPPATP
jgi:hypothetical protein